MLSKKGSLPGYSELMWLVYLFLIVLLIAIILVPFLIYSSSSKKIEKQIDNLERSILLNKIDNCIEKYSFQKEQLKTCIDNNKVAVNLKADNQEITINPSLYEEKDYCIFETCSLIKSQKIINQQIIKTEIMIKNE